MRPAGSPAPPFVHLKVHSAYSLLEGAITIPRLAKLAGGQGFPAVGLTDTNNLFGALEFSDKLAEAGIQPIVGLHAAGRFRRSARGQCACSAKAPISHARSRPARLALLACDERGWQNLMKLSSRAFFDPAEDEPPHVEIERLEAHGAGLIALTGGIDGPIGQGPARGAEGRGARAAEGAREDLRQPALCRDPAPRPQARDRGRAHAARPGLRAGAADRRHQRGLFRRPRRLRGARCAAVHRRGHLCHRGQAPALARASTSSRPPTRWPSCLRTCRRRWKTPSRSPSAAPSVPPGANRSCRASSRPAPTPPRRSCIELEADELRAQAEAGLQAAACRHPAGARLHGGRLPEAARLRDRRHRQDEVPGLLPDRCRLHPVGQGQRHPRGAGTRLGRRLGGGLVAHHHRSRSPALRPAVRALPEPRARVDARLRHRLLPGPPRRGDPLRAAEVRCRPRGPDHHPRQAAGARRAARRGPRAADALWPGRQALQARAQQPRQSRDAGAGHRRRAQAAGGARQRARGGAPVGDRPEARGPLSPRLHARRRHGDRRPAARRAGAALPRSQVELPHHPVQLEAGRGGGPREVRLPGPQDPDRPAEGRAAHQARPRHRHRPLEDPARRPQDLRAARQGRYGRRVPARRCRRARQPEAAEARPLRGHHGHDRALSAGPDGQHPDLHQQEARGGACRLPAQDAGADPEGDLRRHHLPGAGAADRPGDGRLLAGPGRHPAQGHGQEGQGHHGPASRPSSWPAR